MKKKKLPKNILCVAICALIIGILTLICASGQIAYEVADTFECWRPDYAMEKDELLRVMAKPDEELTEDDYSFLYRQTGLTKLGIDRARANDTWGVDLVSEIQDDYFAEHTVKHKKFAPYICFCEIDGHVQNIYLEEGDIVVSYSTQLIGWRMGHSGLVTRAYGVRGEVLQAAAIGTVSDFGDIDDFTDSVGFMVLSPKVDGEIKRQVVNYASQNLLGISYDPFRGLFSSKNKIDTTQCAHLVWYAYNQFGIDIDGNGGGLVTPKDFANSPTMEVVQVFGFNPNELWK